MKKLFLYNVCIFLLLSQSKAETLIQTCLKQSSYAITIEGIAGASGKSIKTASCDNFNASQIPHDGHFAVYDNYAITCGPQLMNCMQNSSNDLQKQIDNLTNRYNTDIGNINNRFNGDEAAINNNHNNVLAQIQATNNSIASMVTNTVNQQLLAQVSQNLPQVVQSQLTPELIAKGLQSQYQTAINTKFKQNSGALYIRGFMTQVNENGGQDLQVYAVDDKDNFCNYQDGFKSPAQATLYMGQKNATTIAAYLFSAYATGKPVVLETQGGKDGSGNPYCSIVNIKQDVDVNTLKA